MADSKEIKAVLGKLVGQLEGFCVYCDALYLENRTQSLSKDKTGVENRVDADSGVKIRAFDGHQYHEACVQGWQPQVLSQEVQKLITKIKQLPPRMGKPLNVKQDKEQLDKEYSTTPKIDSSTINVEEKAALITRLHDKTMENGKDFINCRVSYKEEHEKKVFVSKTKRLSSSWSGCTITIVPFIQTADGQTRYDFFSKFANGFEVKDISEEDLKAFFERAKRVKDAKKIAPGKYHCVLSPNVTGLLAHESFGHGMESDTIMKGRAKAEEYLGKRIAPAKVNICDDPGVPGTHGFVFFDDEGQLARRVYLVQNGVVTDPITESYSA